MNKIFDVLRHEECYQIDSIQNHINSSKHNIDNIQANFEQCLLW